MQSRPCWESTRFSNGRAGPFVCWPWRYSTAILVPCAGLFASCNTLTACSAHLWLVRSCIMLTVLQAWTWSSRGLKLQRRKYLIPARSCLAVYLVYSLGPTGWADALPFGRDACGCPSSASDPSSIRWSTTDLCRPCCTDSSLTPPPHNHCPGVQLCAKHSLQCTARRSIAQLLQALQCT